MALPRESIPYGVGTIEVVRIGNTVALEIRQHGASGYMHFAMHLEPDTAKLLAKHLTAQAAP